MMFMDPLSQGGVSKEFEFKFTGAAVNTVALFLIGSVGALLIICIPYPVLAMNNMRTFTETPIQKSERTVKRLTLFCMRTDPSMSLYELQADVRELEAILDTISGDYDASFWECFGLGKAAVAREMMH